MILVECDKQLHAVAVEHRRDVAVEAPAVSGLDGLCVIICDRLPVDCEPVLTEIGDQIAVIVKRIGVVKTEVDHAVAVGDEHAAVELIDELPLRFRQSQDVVAALLLPDKICRIKGIVCDVLRDIFIREGVILHKADVRGIEPRNASVGGAAHEAGEKLTDQIGAACAAGGGTAAAQDAAEERTERRTHITAACCDLTRGRHLRIHIDALGIRRIHVDLRIGVGRRAYILRAL